MSFELTFLGALGGPVEAGTCAVLVKPAGAKYSGLPRGALLMVDAGLGVLLLAHAIARGKAGLVGGLYPDAVTSAECVRGTRTDPFAGCHSPLEDLHRIMQQVGTFLITHPHLDHVAGLVLNSAGHAGHAGQARVVGSSFTVAALQRHIFNDTVWPDMARLGVLSFCPAAPFEAQRHGVYSVTLMPLRHGSCNGALYYLLAFLLDLDGGKICIFGDFEADASLGENLNSAVWDHIAPYVADGSLTCLVVECLSPTGSTELYGHLLPPHLIAELQALKRRCKSLAGLHVVVTHVKEAFGGRDPRRLILAELDALNAEHGLGVVFSIALGGLLVIV